MSKKRNTVPEKDSESGILSAINRGLIAFNKTMAIYLMLVSITADTSTKVLHIFDFLFGQPQIEDCSLPKEGDENKDFSPEEIAKIQEIIQQTHRAFDPKKYGYGMTKITKTQDGQFAQDVNETSRWECGDVAMALELSLIKAGFNATIASGDDEMGYWSPGHHVWTFIEKNNRFYQIDLTPPYHNFFIGPNPLQKQVKHTMRNFAAFITRPDELKVKNNARYTASYFERNLSSSLKYGYSISVGISENDSKKIGLGLKIASITNVEGETIIQKTKEYDFIIDPDYPDELIPAITIEELGKGETLDDVIEKYERFLASNSYVKERLLQTGKEYLSLLNSAQKK
ncbi:MAG: hypothetical protein WCT36_04685 [Candidatus Gracilibacteria bacterium]|jgi:hypothetical protein